VWGGTYFPKRSRFGRAAFVDVLHEIARLFSEEPAKIEQNRAALMERLAATARPQGRVVIGEAELDQAATRLAEGFDPVHGGLSGAPKFPQASLFEALWRGGRRRRESELIDVIAHTLGRICQGGIYDHLGGGFARYSVDERWLVPHFEKMLYDNAQLLDLVALAAVETKNPLFGLRARETVAWLMREMTTPDGAFCASLDADSEGEEGKFYVWSLDEIERVLGHDDALFFAAHYDVSREGNFEGHNILNRLRGDLQDEATEARLAALRARLLSVRATRVRPGLDDKVLADWNGLMIAALTHAGLLLGEPGWVAMARGAFDFISTAMTRGDRLGHSWRDGKLQFPGLASDYAAMIRAALALFEATGQHPYLDRALAWQAAFDRHHAHPDGGYYLTADDAEGLVVRPFVTHDDATPNPNGLAAQNLVRLAALTGDDRWRDAADRLFDGLLPHAASNVYGHLSLLNALDLRLRAVELVVVGDDTGDLTAAALTQPSLDHVVLRARTADNLPDRHPARAAFATLSAPAVLVCTGGHCSLPVTDPDALAVAIQSVG
jgi:uncharacterized protein YyaL (SSP411 family)